ncbi:MAG: redox-regulated ATPase YchF [Phototrophicaceae bacterium]|jgi:GTP-binding protein YchF
MKLAVLGLPNSGKTTIFNALTGATLETSAGTSGVFSVESRTVNVPDKRIDALAKMYNPKKVMYATITYIDVGGLDKGINKGGLNGAFRNELQQADGFVHVVRAFESDLVPHPYDKVDPLSDLESLNGEFILTDLVTVENREKKLQDELRVKGKKVEVVINAELAVIAKMRAALENEIPLREVDLTEEEVKPMRGFGFLTLKPMLVVVNVGEDNADLDLTPFKKYETPYCRVVKLQGALEAEIAQLGDEDAEMFMQEYNITERSAALVIRASYELLAVQAFFTVGTDEVRAWRTAIGATAPEAAGAIHSDLQKGFIRAEVMKTEELLAAGSEAALKQEGKFRLEGRDYVVRDGDIINIRHSS